ncbi:hypothetical protein V6N12_000881 [Hibiscus sabdariffa]|uniref:Uncharacterized protein n=1 Tax=Hibiscus sabdariffa TaxID=183260 RepID=A0ABR2BXP6_9ROSI
MVSTVRKKEMGGCQPPFSLSLLTEIKSIKEYSPHMGMLPAASDRITCVCRLHSLSFSLSFLHLCLVVRPEFVQNASAFISFHSSLQQCYIFFSSLLYLEYFIFPAQKTITNHLPQAISAEITTKDQVLSHPQTQVVACPQAMEQKNATAEIRSQDMFMAEIHPSEYKATT